jgi:type II secretory pathway component PulK
MSVSVDSRPNQAIAAGSPEAAVRRRGVALIIVLWVMMILTVLMYAFLGDMQVEYSLAGSYGDEKKAEQLAWSAIDFATTVAINNTKKWHALTDEWSNDYTAFFEIPVGDGVYTVFHPTYDDTLSPMWGLEDEASKINLNTATKAMLMNLNPNMTEQMAESILAWRQKGGNPGPQGAQSSYYQALNPAYAAKNQPFESIEELNYIAGMTQEVLYGWDANLNGFNDPGELYSAQHLPPGLFGLVTVWSVDPNVSLAGKARANINLPNAQQLQQAGLTQAEITALQSTLRTSGPFLSIAHLLGGRGVAPVLTTARFKTLADKLTVNPAATIPGLVNINTAPMPVLLALPGMTQDLASKIIAQRMAVGANLSSIGWLTDVLSGPQLQQMANSITCRSYQFRINAVGRIGTPYTANATGDGPVGRPGAMKRMMAVVDLLASPQPRLVYWKDMTKLGMPYDPSAGPGP